MRASTAVVFALIEAVVARLGAVNVAGSTCTVTANGNRTDDVPNILQAFSQCNNGGTVVFPEDQSYWIATKLNPVLQDVTIEWSGQWTVESLQTPSPSKAQLNIL